MKLQYQSELQCWGFYIPELHLQFRKEFYTWCWQNLGKEGEDWIGFAGIFKFYVEEDVTLIKLTFGL